MTAKKPIPLAITLLGCAGLTFALVAAKCESDTDFTDFVDEDCLDGADNDEDGQTDCDDSDCAVQCAVEVAIFDPPDPTNDSLKISGTHTNAASISIQVTPSGTGGSALLESGSGNWAFTIKAISGTGFHTITATATSAKGLRDTAIATFQKGI